VRERRRAGFRMTPSNFPMGKTVMVPAEDLADKGDEEIERANPIPIPNASRIDRPTPLNLAKASALPR
jgi:hypothetical protein